VRRVTVSIWQADRLLFFIRGHGLKKLPPAKKAGTGYAIVKYFLFFVYGVKVCLF